MSTDIEGAGGDILIEPDDCDKRINEAKDVKDDQHMQLKVHLTTANKKMYDLTAELNMLRKKYRDVSKDNETLRSDLAASHANLEFIRENNPNYEVSKDLMESKQNVIELQQILAMAIKNIEAVEAEKKAIGQELTAKKNDLATALKNLTIEKRKLETTQNELSTAKNTMALLQDEIDEYEQTAGFDNRLESDSDGEN
jgi:chromosome segregation ATPase